MVVTNVVSFREPEVCCLQTPKAARSRIDARTLSRRSLTQTACGLSATCQTYGGFSRWSRRSTFALTPGMEGDIAVEGDPLADIHALERVRFVLYKRKALRPQ